MTLLARLHAWGLEGKEGLPWLQDCRKGHLLKYGLPDLFRSSVAEVTEEKLRAAAPALDSREVLEMFCLASRPGLYEFSLDRVAETGPATVVHMDARQGNAFFEEAGPGIKLFDWQAVSYGAGAMDLAYTLSGSLAVEDRRAWQSELLALYLQTFCDLSGSSYSSEQLTADYQCALLWPLVWAALTLANVEATVDNCAGPALDASTASPEDFSKREEARRVAREFVTVGAQRYTQAALDEGSARRVLSAMESKEGERADGKYRKVGSEWKQAKS